MRKIIEIAKEAISKSPEILKALSHKWWVSLSAAFLLGVIVVSVIVLSQAEKFGEIAVQKMGREHFVARFDERKFNVEISSLVKNAKAASASVWVIDIGTNSKQLIYRYVAETGKEDQTYYNEDFPLFYYDENAIAFNQVIRKRITCLNLVPETNFGDALAKEGISYVCFAPVPPDSGQFIGLIELEFHGKPEELIQSESQNNPAKRITFENRLKKASRNIIKR